MWKRLFGKIALFTIPIIVLYFFLFKLGYKPLLTNSISFDAKQAEIKRSGIEKADIMVIGSSTALNDINSEVFKKNYKIAYYNFGAWGLQITDVYPLLKQYIAKYHPKYVIFPSTPADFISDTNPTLPSDVDLGSNYLYIYYIKNFTNIRELMMRKTLIDQWENNDNIFQSLRYDNGGGVPLKIDRNKVDTGRLAFISDIIKGFPDIYTNKAFLAMDSLAGMLHKDHIKLYFIQAPYNSTWVPANKRIVVSDFINKCKSIVEKHGGVYLNYSNRPGLADSLFADPLHLTAKGAALFTQQVINDIGKLN